MKIKNNSKRAYIAYGVKIEAGAAIEVTDKKVLAVLLKQPDVVEFADIEDKKKLEAENEQLKAELELAKAKEKADSLGIKYAANIGLNTLLSKIADFEAEQQ